MPHVHGPGKRWEGTTYTCSECRAVMRLAEGLQAFGLVAADVGAAFREVMREHREHMLAAFAIPPDRLDRQ